MTAIKTTPPLAIPAHPSALPEILKAEEVASLLRINRKTLYEAVQRDEIPGAFRVGRRCLRFQRDALLAFLSPNQRAVLNSERNQG
jgi:excisionase family DNA binding protein